MCWTQKWFANYSGKHTAGLFNRDDELTVQEAKLENGTSLTMQLQRVQIQACDHAFENLHPGIFLKTY